MGKINYAIELEIVEGKGCQVHHTGQEFQYPEDIGNVCPWLLDSVNGIVCVLQFGGTLPWKCQGTPYEKECDEKGVTTEFVRCHDLTSSSVVVKITRTKRGEPAEVGWA